MNQLYEQERAKGVKLYQMTGELYDYGVALTNYRLAKLLEVYNKQHGLENSGNTNLILYGSKNIKAEWLE